MPTIIYPPTLPWNWMFQRPQQLMKQLSFLGYTILYEDKGSFPHPQIKNLWDSFYLCQGVSALSMAHSRPRILWLTFPQHVNLIETYQPDYVVFDCSDEPKEEFADWLKFWKPLLKKSDLVFASSLSLFEQLSSQHRHVTLIRNGVDYPHFTLPQDKPSDLPEKRSLIGYSGAIAPWLDWSLLKDVIADNPALHFIFLGALVKLKQFPLKSKNLSYLGVKPYSILPAYLQQFEVSLIPFRITEMTKGCNPIKLYEYTAAGSNVVATPLPELCQISCPGLYLAVDSISFSESIKQALQEKSNTSNDDSKRSFASQNDWRERAREIHTRILDHCP